MLKQAEHASESELAQLEEETRRDVHSVRVVPNKLTVADGFERREFDPACRSGVPCVLSAHQSVNPTLFPCGSNSSFPFSSPSAAVIRFPDESVERIVVIARSLWLRFPPTIALGLLDRQLFRIAWTTVKNLQISQINLDSLELFHLSGAKMNPNRMFFTAGRLEQKVPSINNQFLSVNEHTPVICFG